MKVSSEANQVRHYLIDRALDDYDDAIAMEMHTLLDRFTDDVVSYANKHGVTLTPSTPEQRTAVRHLMDGFEDKYFRVMRELIDKRRKAEEDS